MQWREPVYLWAQTIPLLILLGWIVAERRRRLRLTTFGDRRLLGVSFRAGRQFLSLALLVLAVAAIVSVLALPSSKRQAEEIPDLTPVAILLDARLANALRSEVGYSMDDVEDVVGSIIEQSPGARFMLFRSGNPVQKIAPITSDEKGLLMLMTRVRWTWQSNPSASLGKSVLEIAALGGKSWTPRIVIVTAEAVDDQPELTDRDGNPEILFVRVPVSESRIDMAESRQGKNWIWGDQIDELRDFLRQEERISPASRPARNWNYIQIFAVFAFCVLLGRSLLDR